MPNKRVHYYHYDGCVLLLGDWI